MGLEDIAQNAFDPELAQVVTISFSGGLIGGVVGGVAAHKITEKLVNKYRKRRGDAIEKSIYYDYRNYIPIVAAVMGAYIGFQAVSYAESILNSVFQRV